MANIRKQANRVLASTVRNTSCSHGWLKQLNQIVFGVATVIVFVVLMMVVLHEAIVGNSETEQCAGCSRCSKLECSVLCLDTTLTEMDAAVYLIQETNEDCASTGISLTLTNSQFPHGRLPFAWMAGISVNIRSLRIIGGNLQHIPPASFLSSPFIKTTDLFLSSVTISKLKAESFFGLPSLKVFTLQSCLLDKFANDVLYPIADTLEKLEIVHSITYNPRNFTGGQAMMSRLTNVNLSYNSFGRNINKYSFLRLKYCKVLDLSNSRIETIQEGAFEPLVNIQSIILENNRLTTISSDIFKSIFRPLSFKVNLENNPWHCNCSLYFIRSMFEQNLLTSELTCDSPEEYTNTSISKLLFICGEETSTMNDLSSENITSSTTASELIINESQEYDYSISSNEVNYAETTEMYEEADIVYFNNKLCDDPTRNKNVTLKCSSELPAFEDWLLKVLLESSDENEGFVLLRKATIVLWNSLKKSLGSINSDDFTVVWFQSICPSEAYCLRVSLRDSIADAYRDEVNFYCLVDNNNKVLEPDYCITYVPTSVDTLRMQSKGFTVTSMSLIFTFSIIGCMTGSAFIVFVTVRQNPTLLKGSKRVLLVRHRVADALILPPKYPGRSKSQRRHSNVSIASVAPSYISALQPTEDQLRTWRLTQNTEENLYDSISPEKSMLLINGPDTFDWNDQTKILEGNYM